MAENSGISWTDNTFNPWMGCTKVSPACKHCYAERDMDHRHHKVAWGPNGTRVVTTAANWRKPLKWNKDAQKAGVRTRVFCASLADVFEDWKGPIVNHLGVRIWVSAAMPMHFVAMDAVDETVEAGHFRPATMDDIRVALFAMIDSTPFLDWLLLTKRPENIKRMIELIRLDGGTTGRLTELDIETPAHRYYRRNVWLGTSVESQEYADKRIPELLKCRDLSPVLFLSCEPLVSSLDLRPALWLEDQYFGLRGNMSRALDWIITGGESGPEARPMHPDWFRDLRDQCKAAGLPFHFKQWGEWAPGTVADRVPHAAVLINGKYCTPDSRDARMALDREVCGQWDRLSPTCMARIGKVRAGRLLDGAEHDAFPEVKR